MANTKIKNNTISFLVVGERSQVMIIQIPKGLRLVMTGFITFCEYARSTEETKRETLSYEPESLVLPPETQRLPVGMVYRD